MHLGTAPPPMHRGTSSQLPRDLTMASSQGRKGNDTVLKTLDGFILIINVAKDACGGVPPAQVALASASTLLAMVRDSVSNKHDFIELGQCCADVCDTLYRGLEGRELENISKSVLDAIGRLATTMDSIQTKVDRLQGGVVARFFHTKIHKEKIAAWNRDIAKFLQIFNTELLFDVHRIVANPQPNQGGSSCPHSQSTQASIPIGEMPPPAPGSCFGRDELIKEVIELAEDLKSIALTGAGGIGKTSIALSVLHHPRIKTRFGHERRFIRCNEFPVSQVHFLSRLSKVIGAGVENPDSLTPLWPFLSSKEMLIIMDNIESILDPQGPNAREIYAIIHQLCQIETICLLITSRIRTVPPRCARPEIPTLSMEAARDIFYDIYGDCGGRSDIIDDLLQGLDFHALSITLLATAASHNDWSHKRLVEEWKAHRAQALRTDFDESLASSIELSLDSPTFRTLGPFARDLLGVIAFFPHGVDEGNLDWLFPTIPERKKIFDKFCVLSLTYRNKDFVTMLAPIRDYLCPQDPKSSSLLCATKDHYFTRLSGYLRTNERRLGEARWIRSEDVNVEHLLDVFTSINMDEDKVWDACCYFLDHLGWHKPRETVLAQRIEGLPDDHRFKPQCLFDLSDLFGAVGNEAERKRLLTCTLKLGRGRGCDSWTAELLRRLPDASRRLRRCREGLQQGKEAAKNFGTAEILRRLSDASRSLGHYKEGVQQAKEAVEIYKRLGDTIQQAGSLKSLAWLLLDDNQLDSAEATISEAIDLIPEEGEENLACRCHRVLGDIYRHKGEKEKAIRHFEMALGIASRFNWHSELFWNHFSLSILFEDQGEFSEANAHVEKAKSYTNENNNTYLLGRATERQSQVWDQQGRLKDAKLEAEHALEIYEKLGAGVDAHRCRHFLRGLNEQWDLEV